MGGEKALFPFAGEPLIARPLAAARASGLPVAVVAKPSTALPQLDVPVWLEPDTPSHPLLGVVTALAHGPIVAVACDQPFVTAELLRALAEHDGPAIAVEREPFPGLYEPSQLAVLRQALDEAASLRATLTRLAPAVLGVPPALVASVNTPEEAAAAEARAVSPDVAVIGGGIVGCALAAFLAEGGARVVLYEREAIAAGASGRNSGVIQDPLDTALTDLYEESLGHYATLGRGFELPAEPSGLLLVSDDPDGLEAPAGGEYLEGGSLRAAEPALADGLVAYRLETGRPVPPAAAAHAWATRAREAGADLRIGTPTDAASVAGIVVVAAGPWTPEVLGAPLPIVPVWGVVVELALEHPPTHVLEEAGIDALTTDEVPDVLFSAVTARGISAVGSTFMADKPDPEALAPRILENARRFLTDLGTRTGLRACARPGSKDGRPILGRARARGVYVAAGHGAWGITLGPASARLVADQVLGRPAEIPPALSVSRPSLLVIGLLEVTDEDVSVRRTRRRCPSWSSCRRLGVGVRLVQLPMISRSLPVP